MDYVFLNNSVNDMNTLNSKLINFNATLHSKVETEGYPVECIDLILGLMCHDSFPLCDYSSDTPVPRQVCVLLRSTRKYIHTYELYRYVGLTVKK